MKSQSKMLKVVSILLIVFGVIGLISNIITIATSSNMTAIYEASGIEAPTMADNVVGILSTLIELAVGIIGVMYRDRKSVLIAAVAFFGITLISIIMSTMKIGFSALFIFSFILPLLYLWGWYQSN